MRSLPLGDAEVDVGLSYSGLHMIPDPERALAELWRCLRPGGRLAGATFLSQGSRRQRASFALGRRTGHAAPKGTATDLERWLDQAGFSHSHAHPRRGFVLFSGRKPQA